MNFTLFPYQLTGKSFLLKRKRCLLADDMGLGKTVQTLDACKDFIEARTKTNILIVAPAGLCLMWGKEIKSWIPDSQVIQLKEMKDRVALVGSARFIIVSYNYLQKEDKLKRLLAMKWDIIVCDEAHSMKNYKSKTCKNFCRIVKGYNGRLWLLTGTPATRSGQDYYTYLNLCIPDKWGTLIQFSDTYCNYTTFGYSRIYQGVKASKKQQLRKYLDRIMLRRRKVEVLTELPPKLEKFIPVSVDEKVISESLDIDVNIIKKCIAEGQNPPAHIMTLMQSIGMSKVPAALEYILDVCDVEPIIVFCRHIEVLESLYNSLRKTDTTVCKLSGSENRDQKQKSIEDFQDRKCDVILCNLKSGGVGHTLTASAHILFVEEDFSPAIMNQAVGRAHRLTQVASCVNVVHLIAEGTVDEDIIENRKQKETFIDYIAGDSHE